MVNTSQLYERLVFSPLLSVADKALAGVRGQLLQQAHGRVLELGIGSGLSLGYYSDRVTELTGLEPSGALLDQCRSRLEGLPSAPPTTLVRGGAEVLPWPDEHFDTVVAFLVFCTIGDPDAAAREIRRVLRPGGRLVFFEHVGAPEARLARWQHRLNPLWSRMACGCQLTRDTRACFAAAGFDMTDVNIRRHPAIPLPLVKPTIEGVVYG